MFSGDSQFFDATETAKVTFCQAPGSPTKEAGSSLFQPETEAEQGNYRVSGNSGTWFIPKGEMANTIQIGDTITGADGVSWTVQSVTYDHRTQAYKLPVVRER